MKKGYVIYSKENGVYLGSMWGLGFWSALDPVGQDAAVIFKNVNDVSEFINKMKTIKEHEVIETYEIIEVEDDMNGYASINSCVKAGIPAWDAEI